jgi:hypothetical protein
MNSDVMAWSSYAPKLSVKEDIWDQQRSANKRPPNCCERRTMVSCAIMPNASGAAPTRRRFWDDLIPLRGSLFDKQLGRSGWRRRVLETP